MTMAVNLWWVFLLLACMILGTQSARPNIVYFLTDDQGHADVSWDDIPLMPTPNLDQLRRDGTELLQFHTHKRCTHSRAALLTGRYAHKLGIHSGFGRNMNETLDLSAKLLPAFLKDMKYKTHLLGKWHLGYCAKAATPTYRGFDTFYGSFGNVQDHYTQRKGGVYDWHWHREGKLEPHWDSNNTYNTDRITDHAVKLLDEHFKHPKDSKKPIFVLVAYMTPHGPIQAPEKCTQDPKCQAIPKDSDDGQRRTYCGMVKCIDDSVGEIVEALKRNKAFDNTIIVYHSDNGPSQNNGASSWPLRGYKNTLYQGGTKSRALIHAPKLLKHAPKKYDGLMHITDMLPTLFTAVKGKKSKLPGELDGISMWNQISKNKTPKSRWLAYSINKVEGWYAIRFRNKTDDYKLVFRSKARCTGWIHDPRPEEQRNDGRGVTVKCPKDGLELFNMRTNPNELVLQGASAAREENPGMFQWMKEKLFGYYMKTYVDAPHYIHIDKYKFLDRNENDKYYNFGGCEYNTQIAEQNQ